MCFRRLNLIILNCFYKIINLLLQPKWTDKVMKFVYVVYSNKGKAVVAYLLMAILWQVYSETMEPTVHSNDISPVTVIEIATLAKRDFGPSDWLDPWYCNLNCDTDKPCEYKDEVDLRIIVLTYQRPESLERCLDSVLDLQTLGDRVSVEIWIDRSKEGTFDRKTVSIADDFKIEWVKQLSKGRACIHLQNKHAFIHKQWTNTWRPKINTKELALILEDDIAVSPFAYQWLKRVHSHFANSSHIAGYTLQSEDTRFFAPTYGFEMRTMRAEPQHKIFLYPVLGMYLNNYVFIHLYSIE